MSKLEKDPLGTVGMIMPQDNFSSLCQMKCLISPLLFRASQTFKAVSKASGKNLKWMKHVESYYQIFIYECNFFILHTVVNFTYFPLKSHRVVRPLVSRTPPPSLSSLDPFKRAVALPLCDLWALVFCWFWFHISCIPHLTSKKLGV